MSNLFYARFVTLPVLVLVAWGTIAFANPERDAEAKLHGERAQVLYRAGQYAEARAEFSAAYDLSGRAGFVFNMAECSRLVGELDAARAHYHRYLALAPEGPLARVARERIAALPPRVSPASTSSGEPTRRDSRSNPPSASPAAPARGHAQLPALTALPTPALMTSPPPINTIVHAE